MVLGEVAVLGKLEEALQVLSNLKNPIGVCAFEGNLHPL